MFYVSCFSLCLLRKCRAHAVFDWLGFLDSEFTVIFVLGFSILCPSPVCDLS